MSKQSWQKWMDLHQFIDTLVKEHGIMTAAVFGKMWRYCQWLMEYVKPLKIAWRMNLE